MTQHFQWVHQIIRERKGKERESLISGAGFLQIYKAQVLSQTSLVILLHCQPISHIVTFVPYERGWLFYRE